MIKKFSICIVFVLFYSQTIQSKTIVTDDKHNSQPKDVKNDPEAFYVIHSRNTAVNFGAYHRFDRAIINRGDIFQESTSTANLKNKNYWFSFSVTSNKYLGGLNVSGLEFRQDPRPEKTITTQIELFLNKPNTVAAQEVLLDTTVLGNESLTQTSWLGFQVDTPVVFSGLNNKLVEKGFLQFQSTTFNPLYFNVLNDGRIKILSTAYYYLSFTFPARRNVNTILKVNTTLIAGSEIDMRTDNYLSTSTASKSLIVRLSEGDFLGLEVIDGGIFSAEQYSSVLSLISIQSSTHFASVVRQNDFISLQLMDFNFPVVQQNVGDSWDTQKSQFVCKSSGLYKVSMSLGARNNFQLRIEILKNQQVIGILLSDGPQDTTRRVISRSLLVNLQLNDIISVKGIGITDVGVTSSILNIFKI